VEGVLSSIKPQSDSVVFRVLRVEQLGDRGALNEVGHHKLAGSFFFDELVGEEARNARVSEEEFEVLFRDTVNPDP
jgi:hypothetical protein